jgi:hypothetical protein
MPCGVKVLHHEDHDEDSSPRAPVTLTLTLTKPRSSYRSAKNDRRVPKQLRTGTRGSPPRTYEFATLPSLRFYYISQLPAPLFPGLIPVSQSSLPDLLW